MSLQRLYRMILETSGFQVLGAANNGEEAVNFYINFQEKPDIILMDHRMPIKNGVETTKEIIKISNHSKIIFTSADKTIKNEALSIGAVSFLEKPFSFADLVAEIKKVLNGSYS
ncbi:MAG: response regulator [Candidatus Lokiarchaeota archaeon]|nr:response regulator [Candidatus Lokiarchaeota archaeon]